MRTNRSIFPRALIKRYLTGGDIARVRKYAGPILAYFFRNDLRALADIYGTDKWGYHWYAQHYQNHFRSIRKNRLVILEIGVGGYGDPKSGGGSLKMWKAFFPNAEIHGLDRFDKSHLNGSRIFTHLGEQQDERLLRKISEDLGGIDIVIDDGSHVNEHVITSFKTLFPLLKENGVYVIEDLHTSYQPEFGGKADPRDSKFTTVDLLKSLLDGLHANCITARGLLPEVENNIASLHFYHNLAFIYKRLATQSKALG